MIQQGTRGFYGAAYAKINLYLTVEGKRSDGFHDILSVMQTVSLADTVYGSITPAKETAITLSMPGCGIPCDETNLAYRAAQSFLTAAKLSAKVSVTVEKKIPVAAGLAGGSADAAAVLRLFNEAMGRPLNTEQLLALAASLGSDVPFCLLGGTRLCSGRGEKTEPLPSQEFCYVIAVPDACVSTQKAYRELDRLYSDFDGSRQPLTKGAELSCKALTEGPGMLASSLFNLFEEPIIPINPAVEELKNKMKNEGALGTLMSGSGPSVFGIFANIDAAERAAKAIKNGAVAVKNIGNLL